MSAYFIGVDVGTGSVRAGLFDASGGRLGIATRDIVLWKPQANFVEQSSDDIWRACCTCVREVVEQAGVGPGEVKGIGFDATCSLVVLDAEDRPVTVSPTGSDERNVVVWMDHRAVEQAERINRSGHPVLRYVGGRISPEMQTPKLVWLRENLPDTWRRAARFLDLPDFLSYRATGDDTRSLCTTVCKWTYLGHETGEGNSQGRWDASYFERVGLEDLAAEKFERIGKRVRPMGEPVGKGLTEWTAGELGLAPGTAVSVSLIDAHAGGLGTIGISLDDDSGGELDFDKRLTLIGGTSSCHMAVSREPRFIEGVWGPYYSAMVPGCWLTEGGQSATGALIDHVIFNHPMIGEVRKDAEEKGTTVYDALNERLSRLAKGAPFPASLTRELHVFPDFHGNRSPRADATLRGMVSGLSLSATADDLALLYLATIQAIACGTRHIIETLNAHGYRIDTILACGGGTKNEVFLREHADVTGCRIVIPQEPEAVLLGGAILSAVAFGHHSSIVDAMKAMTAPGRVVEPTGESVKAYHQAKYWIFHRLYEDQMAYRGSMKESENSGTSRKS